MRKTSLRYTLLRYLSPKPEPKPNQTFRWKGALEGGSTSNQILRWKGAIEPQPAEEGPAVAPDTLFIVRTR